MSEVWPRRNLGRAENWGRNVENRLKAVDRSTAIQTQSQSGFGRFTVSTSESIVELADRVRDALNALPRTISASSSASGFSLGASWMPVCSVTVSAPDGFTKCDVSAVGSTFTSQTGSPSTRFIWPFSLSYVTSEFGPRPPLPFHNGIDFAYSGITGAAIPATHNGTIILRGYYDDWGNYTRIDCSDLIGISGSWTGYAHMNAPGLYGVGTVVTQGQTIGYVGSTGYVTGPHLHYETAPGGSRTDPRVFMDNFQGVTGGYKAVEARITVNGTPSVAFQPYTMYGYSAAQSNYPVSGASLGNVNLLTVSLEMRTDGNVPASPPQTATLTVQGAFRR